MSLSFSQREISAYAERHARVRGSRRKQNGHTKAVMRAVEADLSRSRAAHIAVLYTTFCVCVCGCVHKELRIPARATFPCAPSCVCVYKCACGTRRVPTYALCTGWPGTPWLREREKDWESRLVVGVRVCA